MLHLEIISYQNVTRNYNESANIYDFDRIISYQNVTRNYNFVKWNSR